MIRVRLVIKVTTQLSRRKAPILTQASPARTRQLQELVDALGEDKVITNPATIDNYRWGRANDPDAGTSMAVVRATSAEDVQPTGRFAASGRIPAVAWRTDSWPSGGSAAVDGGIILSTEKMRDIEIGPVTRIAVVQPHAFNTEVKDAAAEQGL